MRVHLNGTRPNVFLKKLQLRRRILEELVNMPLTADELFKVLNPTRRSEFEQDNFMEEFRYLIKMGQIKKDLLEVEKYTAVEGAIFFKENN